MCKVITCEYRVLVITVDWVFVTLKWLLDYFEYSGGATPNEVTVLVGTTAAQVSAVWVVVLQATHAAAEGRSDHPGWGCVACKTTTQKLYRYNPYFRCQLRPLTGHVYGVTCRNIKQKPTPMYKSHPQLQASFLVKKVQLIFEILRFYTFTNFIIITIRSWTAAV